MTNSTTPTFQELIVAAERATGISMDDIKSTSRQRAFIRPRQVICFLAVELRGDTSVFIGTQLNRDHSTVLHACSVVAASAGLTVPLPILEKVSRGLIVIVSD